MKQRQCHEADSGGCGSIRGFRFSLLFGCEERAGAIVIWSFLAYSGRAEYVGGQQERRMARQPPKQNKKKAQHTAKEKKSIKQQKKHASDQVPFIKQ